MPYCKPCSCRPFWTARPRCFCSGSFTGGVLLTPFVYLVFEFLRQQHRYHLLGLDTSNPPLRTSLIIWCSLFFIIGIGTQMVLSPALERLLLIIVFLPNVVMAWKFGWQGGVLSGLLGSMMITIARQVASDLATFSNWKFFSLPSRCWGLAWESLSAASSIWR
ncbi:integral membrane sensor signal transduction histidine kinase [Enterobacter cloacae]|uniref:Integral membrane sensor signal transduction histidine kinase n=1 Tax=Enterobacter cloacae TaxID=550 RepID=A0A377M6M7_ENTCL|nr:integral membrane sensor signal transduction histidine kinase [Enterobacter cloacae]